MLQVAIVNGVLGGMTHSNLTSNNSNRSTSNRIKRHTKSKHMMVATMVSSKQQTTTNMLALLQIKTITTKTMGDTKQAGMINRANSMRGRISMGDKWTLKKHQLRCMLHQEEKATSAWVSMTTFLHIKNQHWNNKTWIKIHLDSVEVDSNSHPKNRITTTRVKVIFLGNKITSTTIISNSEEDINNSNSSNISSMIDHHLCKVINRNKDLSLCIGNRMSLLLDKELFQAITVDQLPINHL